MKAKFMRTNNIHEMQQNAAIELLYRNDQYLKKQIDALRFARTRDAIVMFIVVAGVFGYLKKAHEENKSE